FSRDWSSDVCSSDLFVKTTKNPIDVGLVFYPNFIESIRSRQMFQKFFRNSFNLFYQFENILNFYFYFLILFLVKLNKMIFIKNYLSIHFTKLSQKRTFSKFLVLFRNFEKIGCEWCR